MRYALYSAVITLAAVSSPAFAQDAANSSGFYVGGLVGIDSVELSVDSVSESEEDILYGVTVGYDFVLESGYVFGIEGEWADSSVGASVTDALVVGDEASLSAGRDLYIGMRAGVQVGRGILYLKGGYTNARFIASYDDGFDRYSASDELDGFRIGAGGEFSLNNHIGVRLEYRYSDYGDYIYEDINTGISASRNQGVVTLLGKF